MSYTDLDGTRHAEFALTSKTVLLDGRWRGANGTGGPDCALENDGSVSLYRKESTSHGAAPRHA